MTRAGNVRPPSGFTLIELVVVIVVIGAIFAAGSIGMGRAFESYDLTRKVTDVDWQGRVALERMARELREVRSATLGDLSFPAGGNIRFVDADGNAGCFVVSAGSLQRGDDGPAAGSCATNLRPLADYVVSLNVDYYDGNGAAPGDVTQVFYVAVALQVSRDGISETYRTSVQPRRF